LHEINSKFRGKYIIIIYNIMMAVLEITKKIGGIDL